MSLEFVTSEKGKKMLLLDNHLFYYERSAGDTKYWRCKSQRKTKCRSRVVTSFDVVKMPPKEHNHWADARDVEVAKHMEQLRILALTTSEAPRLIVTKIVASCGEAAAYRMASNDSLRRTIRFVTNFAIFLRKAKAIILQVCETK